MKKFIRKIGSKVYVNHQYLQEAKIVYDEKVKFLQKKYFEGVDYNALAKK